jgi:hypothetical protein
VQFGKQSSCNLLQVRPYVNTMIKAAHLLHRQCFPDLLVPDFLRLSPRSTPLPFRAPAMGCRLPSQDRRPHCYRSSSQTEGLAGENFVQLRRALPGGGARFLLTGLALYNTMFKIV